MAHPKDGSGTLRPPTEVLTRGFNPSLSFGSARPAVFRSSTQRHEKRRQHAPDGFENSAHQKR